MTFMTASAAAALLGADLIGQDKLLSQTFKVDSREVLEGDVFVARKGKSSDGQLHIEEAIKRGASAILAQCPREVASDLLATYPHVAFILAKNAQEAMVSLAKHWLDAVRPQTLGITGSVGKTTTRELITQTLAGHVPLHSAIRSYNTLVGCSMTILSMPHATRQLVLELGTNHFGEIEELVGAFPVHSAIITELAPAHLEHFGSLEGVLKAKMEIIRSGITDNLSYNYDNSLLRAAVSNLPKEIKTLGVGGRGADFVILKRELRQSDDHFLLFLECGWEGESFEITLPLFGLQHAHNAAHAYIVARNLGMSHRDILEKFMLFEAPPGRGRVCKLAGGGWFLDESYNANPSSLGAVVQNVQSVVLPDSQKKIAVIAGMKELGVGSREYHRQLLASATGFDSLLLVGAEWDGIEESGSPIVARVRSTEEIAPFICDIAKDRAFILLKGSRFYEMETLIPVITGGAQP